jgi:hypothetical protein
MTRERKTLSRRYFNLKIKPLKSLLWVGKERWQIYEQIEGRMALKEKRKLKI